MRSADSLTSLLDLDPDLGRLLAPQRVAEAGAALRVRVALIRRGAWDAAGLAAAQPGHLGLLVLDGVVAREVLVADTTSMELLGGGDVLRPWQQDDEDSLARHEIRWTALTDLRLAVLDRQFTHRLTQFPEVNEIIVERLVYRAQRLAVTQAISQLNGVDRRLLALFWHLAERWGRMTPGGIAVPLALSHRELGELVGARRPTISTALGELTERGELVRRGDGSWVLTGEPTGVPTREVRRVIEHRRRLMPRPAAARAANEATEDEERAVTRRERLVSAREQDADLRSSEADERERMADERELSADERDRAAEDRERLADERERLADARDETTAQHERERLERARRTDERRRPAERRQHRGRRA